MEWNGWKAMKVNETKHERKDNEKIIINDKKGKNKMTGKEIKENQRNLIELR